MEQVMEQGIAPNSIPRLVYGANGATFVAGQLVYHELGETLTEVERRAWLESNLNDRCCGENPFAIFRLYSI